MTYEYKVCTLSGIGNSGVETILNQNATESWRVFQITTSWVVFERTLEAVVTCCDCGCKIGIGDAGYGPVGDRNGILCQHCHDKRVAT